VQALSRTRGHGRTGMRRLPCSCSAERIGTVRWQYLDRVSATPSVHKISNAMRLLLFFGGLLGIPIAMPWKGRCDAATGTETAPFILMPLLMSTEWRWCACDWVPLAKD